MNLRDTTPAGQSERVSFELDLPHPPAKVWRALTEAELLGRWLLPAHDLTLEVGAAFTFRRDPMPGWDGVVHGRVLEVDPQRLLRFGWVVGELDTVVTFTLLPSDAGTRLQVVQAGFREDQKKNWGGARYGWNQMGGQLVALLGSLP